MRVNLLRAHGTRYRYKHGRCRCVACRAAESECSRRYYQENRDRVSESQRLYREANREVVAEKNRRWRDANSEHRRRYRQDNPKKAVAYQRRYYEANRTSIAEYHRQWHEENREERAEYARLYQAKHRRKTAERQRRYRATHLAECVVRNRSRDARKRGVSGAHTAADVRAQLKRQKGRCFWGRSVNPGCAVTLRHGYHVDHVIPLAGERATSNGPENIVLACPSCNLRKGVRDPMDFAGVLF